MISASIESGVHPSRSIAWRAALMQRSLLHSVSPASRRADTPAMPVTLRISSSLNSPESVRLSKRFVGTQEQTAAMHAPVVFTTAIRLWCFISVVDDGISTTAGLAHVRGPDYIGRPDPFKGLSSVPRIVRAFTWR